MFVLVDKYYSKNNIGPVQNKDLLKYLFVFYIHIEMTCTLYYTIYLNKFM